MSHTNPKTKGELAVGIGAGFTVLPVGPDGQVLTADSAMATGIKWAPGGGGGAVPPLTQTRFVDWSIGNDGTGDGSIAKPYKTITRFLADVASTTDPPTDWVALISPGQYDEDLAIDATNRHVALIGLGSWMLGNFNAPGGTSAWSPSGTARNINVTTTLLSTTNNVRSALVIGTIAGVESGVSTHLAYSTAARISGQIRYSSPLPSAASTELHLGGVQVFDFGATGRAIDVESYPGNTNCWWWRSRFGASTPVLTPLVYGPGRLRLQVARECRFDGLISIAAYSRIESCRVVAGLTCGSASSDEQPSGMINTNFAGTFTGPAASARMDGNTNYWFKTNGATLAGGATKVIQDDLVP